jgi:transposase
VTRVLVGSDLGAQPAILALDVRDQLPAGHVVFGLIENMRRVDMSAFGAAYRLDGVGRPPYDPRVIVTVLLYCRMKGITSTRGVAMACRDDLGAMLITGGRHPDRSTLDRFVDTHGEAIKALLAQTLRLGHPLGLVDLSVVAGDGSYIDANAAMSATLDEAKLVARIEQLRQRVTQAEALWLAEVADQVTVFALTGEVEVVGPRGDASSEAWRRWQSQRGQLRQAERALDYLRTHPATATQDWQDRLDRDRQRAQRCQQRLAAEHVAAEAAIERRRQALAAGARLPGTKPETPEQYLTVRRAQAALDTATARAVATATERPTDRVNITDPASRIMPSKHGDGFAQRHNLQVLSCRRQFILAVTTHNSSTDNRAMVTLLHTGRANLNTAGITDPIGAALFDCGYASTANFTAQTPVTQLIVAVEKEARQTARLDDQKSTAREAWATMAERLADHTISELYKQRGAIVEPAFAQLANRFGTEINYRDTNVDTELHLRATAHNLLKIMNTQRRRRPDN